VNIISGELSHVTISRDGRTVLVIKNGRAILRIPWDAAEMLGKALIVKAREAEELVEAESIIADQAILTRLGVPVGLTSNRAMQKAAANEAAWNTDLRRYIPPGRAGGIASQEIFGTPAITAHPPKREVRNGSEQDE
jgi:hypothetical protein